MSWIARTYSAQGDYSSAQTWYQRSLDTSSDSNSHEEAVALHGLAMIDLKKGDYEAARDNFEKSMKTWQQIGDRAGESSTWHNLATIDLKKGDYEAARDKFEMAMKIRQQIGDRAGEASTWHNLASIDLEKGDYEAARDKFEKAMKIMQQIGDRAGEAATFYQLGILSWERDPTLNGLRLVALSYLINNSIGHERTKTSFENLSRMASKLKYTQELSDYALKEVADAYRKDRGQSLIDAAFPKA
jgi:tetratricopeptide (TPR) repeat protein